MFVGNPREFVFANFVNRENFVATDEVFVESTCFIRKRVARSEEFRWNVGDTDTITNTKTAPRFGHSLI